MPAATVVTVLDPRADLELGLFPDWPDAAVVEVGFQRREERFGHRVVPAGTRVSHRPGDAVGSGEGSVLCGRVLGEFNRSV